MDELERRFATLASSAGGGSESPLLLHVDLCRIHTEAGTVCALTHELDEGRFGHELQVAVTRKK